MRSSTWWAIGVLGVLGSSGCATGQYIVRPVEDADTEQGWSPPPLITVEDAWPAPAVSARQQIVDAARRWLDQRKPAHDCSSFVRAVLDEAGFEVPLDFQPGDTGSRALFRHSRPVAQPRPGDIVVFHNTWDRNRNGRLDDPYSHIALVEQVEDGRVTLIHRGGSGVTRLKMNVHRPADRTENGILRPAGRHPAARAGELFGGFGAIASD